MGTPLLLDTNLVIYYLDGRLPEHALDFLENNLDEFGSHLSVINKIELLGWQAPTTEAMLETESFVADSTVLWLNDDIVQRAINIRRSLKIKLPDAVIAATALAHDFTLVSRNDADFRKIPGLKYLNPFTDI